MAGMEEAEDEDEDESRLELCDIYFVEGKSEESDESEEDGLAKDPDFTSCGTRWLDSEDSCRRSLQIALQRAKCRCASEAGGNSFRRSFEEKSGFFLRTLQSRGGKCTCRVTQLSMKKRELYVISVTFVHDQIWLKKLIA